MRDESESHRALRAWAARLNEKDEQRIKDAEIVTELNAAIEGDFWPTLSPEQMRRVLALLAAA